MKKYYLISILLFCTVVSSFAQIVVNADKSYATDVKSSIVHVTAVAILNGMPSEDDINSGNYHKAVPINAVSQDRVMTPAVVEITVTAQDAIIAPNNTVKKEAVIGSPDLRQSEVKIKPTVIEKSFPAIRQ